LATWVTSAGSWQPLTAYGPTGVLAVPIEVQPAGLAMKPRNFLAASSFVPSVEVGM
jgi:hypothetical protein